MERKKKFILALILIMTTMVIYATFNAISIWVYAKESETQKADVAIVLGAAVYGEEVSPVFRERINHSVWLYNNGFIDKIIMTGGYSEGNELSDSYIAKSYAVSCGVDENDIFIEELSAITQENLKYAKEIMIDQGFETALIVSDPLHMKRAMLLAKDAGIDCSSSPTTTSRYISLKSKLKFLCREVFYYTGYKIVAGF
ncbi:MAG: YdcF family protein [Clostridia bacterium]|nr:YdcF family protein [Clostridia bacterium]